MFTIHSCCEIGIGDSVYDSYGKKCQHRFLLNYGFAIENNREPDGKNPNQLHMVSIQKRRRSNVAVIIVRIVFISAFIFYCLLCNHSFPTNPNSVTNCFQLYSLSIYNFTNYICSMRSSIFDF
jgi:hypothetical protein